MAIVRDLARPDAILDEQLDYSPDPDKVNSFASAAASDNATLVKASGGQIHVITGRNVAAADRYLKLYDLARVPLSTDTPKLRIALPLSTGFALNYEGLKFRNGIAYRIVVGAADADATALTAGDITGFNLTYE